LGAAQPVVVEIDYEYRGGEVELRRQQRGKADRPAPTIATMSPRR
jgi:hypothetical protein